MSAGAATGAMFLRYGVFAPLWGKQRPTDGCSHMDGCNGIRKMLSLEVSERELWGAASPLPLAKLLTYGRLVAHRYLIEDKGYCRLRIRGKAFALQLVVLIEMYEKE